MAEFTNSISSNKIKNTSKATIFNQSSKKKKDRRIGKNAILSKSKIQNRLKIIYFQNSRKATIFNQLSLKKKKKRIDGNNAILPKSKRIQDRLIERTKIDHLLFLHISIFYCCPFLIAREGSVNRARQPSRTVLMKANKVARG